MKQQGQQEAHSKAQGRRSLREDAAASQVGYAPTEAGPQITGGGLVPQPEDEEDPYLGRVLGGLYRVERKLGEGGMGVVYLARHVHLEKHFAVKVLSPQIAANRQAVERLHREALAASRIEHEGIVDIVNFDITEQGEVFIVMEYLRGESLAERLAERGALPLEEALPIAVQIARALQAAHDHGIVHRDLKPENVMLVRKGGRELVKVLDFGISRVRTAEAEQVRVTRTGQLMGTPLYMSPEQARGERSIDHRADVYALGVMLYEMLTGTPPFEGGNYFQLLWKHGNETPEPPSKRNPQAEIPPAVERIVLKALSKDPADRFQSMAELEEALLQAEPERACPEALGSGNSVRSSASSAPWARLSLEGAPLGAQRWPRWLWLVVPLGVLLLGGLGWWWSSQGGAASGASAASAGERSGVRRVVPHGGRRGRGAAEPAETHGANAPSQRAGQTQPPSGQREPQGASASGAPSLVTLRFESAPPGAEVWFEGRLLGRTPLQATLPATQRPVAVRFRRQGYEEAVVMAPIREGDVVRARLRRLRRGSAGARSTKARRTKGLPLPIKTEL